MIFDFRISRMHGGRNSFCRVLKLVPIAYLLFLNSTAVCQIDLLNQEINQQGFHIELSIEKDDDNIYKLITDVVLEEGNYIYSPLSKDDFYHPLIFSLKNNKDFILIDDLIESPLSLPEIDPYINTPVNYIRTNTTYTQKIKILNKKDFKHKGMIEYLLEPSCVPYDLEFLVKQEGGKLSVEKMELRFSEEYRK